MKTEELRKGNYVWDDYSGEMIVCGVTPIDKVNLRKTTELPCGLYSIKDIKPIPLTEQWLEDFGWYEENGYWYDKDKSHRIHSITTHELTTSILEVHYSRFIDEETLNTEWVYIKEFQNVHQLQNLYFALTDEELKS